MNDWSFDPIWPWQWLTLAAFVTGGFFTWSVWRGVHSPGCRWTVLALRLLALSAVCAVLLQPQRRLDIVTVLHPQLAVLVDDSESMTDRVDGAQPPRSARVKQWLDQAVTRDARNDFDVRIFGFGQGISEQPQGASALRFDAGSSNLIGALAQTLERFRGQPLAAVLMLSDGLDTTGAASGEAAFSTAPAAPVASKDHPPVYTFELEKPFVAPPAQRRVNLAGADFPTRLVVDRDAEIRVNAAGHGMSGQTVGLELWRDGKKLRESTATFNEDEQTRQVVFNVREERTGRIPYEVRLADPAADKNANAFPFSIDVIDAGHRVIYLQNTLGFDFKYLRKAILADRDLQLSAFTRWGDGRIVSIAQPGTAAGNSKLDFSAPGLASCVAVVLGDLAPDALTAEEWEGIRQFVDRGGGLVLLGGPKGLAADLGTTALAAMLPVKTPAPYREGTFPLEITSVGSHHPVFGSLFNQTKSLPALLTCNVTGTTTPTAETLIQMEVPGEGPKPVVVAGRYGQGRVLVVLSDTIWRWRLASQGWTGTERSAYDAFWAQTMDWLAPKDQDKGRTGQLDLFTERPTYLLGEKPEVRGILRLPSTAPNPPATIPLRIQTPDGKTFDYVMRPASLQTSSGRSEPGFRVEVEPNVPGVFQAHAKIATGAGPVEGETRFTVTRPVTEITGKAINRDLLRRLAESNGGRFFGLDEWSQWRTSLHVTEQRFSRTELQDLWNHPALLGFICAALAAEWFVRKLNNLP